MRVKDAVGRFGEQIACDHLRELGLTILDRNWRCPSGEIDVVALDGDELVVVEVKTRSSQQFGSPLHAVDRAKIVRLRRLAVMWMAQAGAQSDQMSAPDGTVRRDPPRWAAVRFDVVAVVRVGRGARLDVTHIRGAF